MTSDRGPACHGFANGCVCDRCRDRELRSEVYARELRLNAAALAKKDSDEYFVTPWRFDGQKPPRRLKPT